MARKRKTKQEVGDTVLTTLDLYEYNPSDHEKEVIARVYNRYRSLENIRDRQYRYFNNRNLVDLINDAQKRFNGYVEPRNGPNDWGAKTIDPLTRNKVIFVLASLAAQRTKVNFYKEDGDDAIRSKIVKAMHEHSYIDENEEIQTFYEMLSAVVKGTVIGYEGFKAPKQKIKAIDSYDPETGEIKWTEKTITLESKVFSEIVPLEDFFPGDLRQRDIQKMPDLVWRTVMPFSMFKVEFKKYANAKYVQKGGDTMTHPFFKDYVQNLEGDEVEVVRYFNKVDDEFHIMANGVLLTQYISPMPWKHKEKGMGYPFWSTIYEPYDEKWFYGKPLPEKLRSNQDTLDALYRMMLDQTFLSIHKPVLTSAVEDVEDDMLRPGRKIPVTDVNEWKELDISAPNGGQFQMFEIVRRSIEDASASDTVTGLRNDKEKTATQASIEKEGAQTLLSMFKNFLEWGAEQKARLRTENQLQFYPLPIGIEDGKVKYRKIRVDNVPLILQQRNGSIILKFCADKSEITPVEIPNELRARFEDKYGKRFDEVSVTQLSENIEEVKMTPEFIEDFNVGIKVIADSSQKMSEGLQKAMALEFVDRVVTVFPDLVRRDAVARDLIDIYDKNPDEYLITSPSEQDQALQRSQQVSGGQQGQQVEPGRASDLIERLTGKGRADQQVSGGRGQGRPGPSAGPTVSELAQ